MPQKHGNYHFSDAAKEVIKMKRRKSLYRYQKPIHVRYFYEFQCELHEGSKVEEAQSFLPSISTKYLVLIYHTHKSTRIQHFSELLWFLPTFFYK